MEVKGFTLINTEKVSRALEGTLLSDGVTRKGGVVKEDGTYDDDRLLAEYDKLGGAIFKGSDKVIRGSFWDFKNKKPRAKSEVKFIYRVNGRNIEVSEGSELPGIVKASKILKEEEEVQKKTKKK